MTVLSSTPMARPPPIIRLETSSMSDAAEYKRRYTVGTEGHEKPTHGALPTTRRPCLAGAPVAAVGGCLFLMHSRRWHSICAQGRELGMTRTSGHTSHDRLVPASRPSHTSAERQQGVRLGLFACRSTSRPGLQIQSDGKKYTSGSSPTLQADGECDSCCELFGADQRSRQRFPNRGALRKD